MVLEIVPFHLLHDGVPDSSFFVVVGILKSLSVILTLINVFALEPLYGFLLGARRIFNLLLIIEQSYSQVYKSCRTHHFARPSSTAVKTKGFLWQNVLVAGPPSHPEGSPPAAPILLKQLSNRASCPERFIHCILNLFLNRILTFHSQSGSVTFWPCSPIWRMFFG